MIFFTIFTGQGGRSTDTRGGSSGAGPLPSIRGEDHPERWRRWSGACKHCHFQGEPLSSCTLPLLAVVALVYREQCLRLQRCPDRSLCFALPSHSDNRARHVLLPVWTFSVAAVLHWMSLNERVDFFTNILFRGFLFGRSLAGFYIGTPGRGRGGGGAWSVSRLIYAWR